MNYVTAEELLTRLQVRLQRSGNMIKDPIALHATTRRKHEGFCSIGPIFPDCEVPWMDIWVGFNKEHYDEINVMLEQVCIWLNVAFKSHKKSH